MNWNSAEVWAVCMVIIICWVTYKKYLRYTNENRPK